MWAKLTHEARDEVERVVNAANLCCPGRGHVIDRNKIRLVERENAGGLIRRRLDVCRAVVAEDGRVNPAVEGGSTETRERTDPIVVDRLVGVELVWIYQRRVPFTSL